VTYPEPPEPTLRTTGWEFESEDRMTSTKEVFVVEFDVYTHAKKYVYTDDDAKGVFFANATRTDPSPADLPFGVGEEQVWSVVTSKALDRLKDELRDRGVRRMDVEEETTREKDGASNDTLEFERVTATYDGNAASGWLGVARRDDGFLTARGVSTGETTDGTDTTKDKNEDILRLIGSTV
jgi:hypothetical protein